MIDEPRVISHTCVIECNASEMEAMFQAALAASDSPMTAFAVEIQHAVNQIVNKYCDQMSLGDLLMTAMPLSFAAARISVAMRSELALPILQHFLTEMMTAEVDASVKMLRDLNADSK